MSLFVLSTASLLLAYFTFLSTSVSPAQALTTVPTTMNFQGRLADSTGTIMPDGLYNMQFSLYTVSSGGSTVWTETRQNNGTDYRVQVTNGLFSTKLGQVSPLSASLFASGSLYFEITMATPATATCSTASCASWESPMTPRHELSTSAYAYNAETLDGYDSADLGKLASNNTWTANNLFKTTSATALEVQNASGTNLLTADTSAGTVTVGTAGTLAGSLVLAAATSGTVTLTTQDSTTSYELALPSAAPSTSQCLTSGATTATDLEWAACGSGGGATTALDNLASTDINVALNATANDLTLQTTTSGDINMNSAGAVNITAVGDVSIASIVTASASDLSVDAGFDAGWTQTSTSNLAWYGVSSSSDGSKLAAVIYSGSMYTSTDFGNTWTNQNKSGNWQDIASSSDGTKLVLGGDTEYLQTSADSGETWTQRTGPGQRNWQGVASSSDGTKLVAAPYSHYIYTSIDSGANWTEQTNSGDRLWRSVASSSDGTKLAAVVNGGYIYTSTDSGATWTEQTNSGSYAWNDIASSSDGTKLAAVVTGISGNRYIYTSTDSGATWTEQTAAGSRDWETIASSADGTQLMAAANTGYIYYSSDSGATWTEQTAAGSRSWQSLASNDDGTRFVAAPESDSIYTWSADSTTTIRGNSVIGGMAISADGNDSNLSAVGSININSDTNLAADVDLQTDGVTRLTGTGQLTNITNYLQNTGDFTVGTMLDTSIAHDTIDMGHGAAWTERTSAGSASWQGIASSSDGTMLVTARANNYIYTSANAGATWIVRTSAGSRNWRTFASSSDGTKLAATVYGGYIYTSTDSGATWTEQTTSGSRDWTSIASSSDGTKLAASVISGYIYTSTDSGATWTERTTSGSRSWNSVTSSSDGTYLAAVDWNLGSGGYIYTSTDSGATWTTRTGSGSRNWYGIASSSDGANLAAVADGGYVYTSTNYGANWTTRTSAGSSTWRRIASDSDGSTLIATRSTGNVYVSTDSGASWTAQTEIGSMNSLGAVSSSDGNKLAVTAYGGYIYTFSLKSIITFQGDVNTTTMLFGTSGTVGGTLEIAGATSGSVTISIPDTTTSYNLVLPSAAGSADQCLVNSSTPGTLTWASCGGATTALDNLASTDINAALNATGNDLTLQTTTSGDINLNSAGGVLMQLGADSVTAFEIQNSSTNVLFGVDTLASKVLFGEAGSVGGALQIAAATSGTVTISIPSTTTSYNLVLPSAAGSEGECLVNSSTPGTLTWGTCGGGGTQTVSFIPEYIGAVFSADGSDNNGVMTSDYDSTNNHNYYEWTSSQATAQDYDIVLRHQLPSDFNATTEFDASSWKIWTYVDNTTNAAITMTVKDSDGTACANAVSVESGSTGWQQITLTDFDTNASCDFTADSYITIDLKLSSTTPNTDKVRVGEIEYKYTN